MFPVKLQELTRLGETMFLDYFISPSHGGSRILLAYSTCMICFSAASIKLSGSNLAAILVQLLLKQEPEYNFTYNCNRKLDLSLTTRCLLAGPLCRHVPARCLEVTVHKSSNSDIPLQRCEAETHTLNITLL